MAQTWKWPQEAAGFPDHFRIADKCRILAKRHLEFHAGDLIGSEHGQECLNCEAPRLGANYEQTGHHQIVKELPTIH